jgi:hypothetical protein
LILEDKVIGCAESAVAEKVVKRPTLIEFRVAPVEDPTCM